ncbi:hypothetical protein [Laspinema olomoucense]|nr:hypothetical protein [Laspinema sp. D3c]
MANFSPMTRGKFLYTAEALAAGSTLISGRPCFQQRSTRVGGFGGEDDGV